MALNNDIQRKKMLTEPMGRLLFKMAYPTTIIQLITIIYNTADTYFVAKINTAASAAVGIVFSIMAVIQAVGFGIGMGASSLISRNLGAEKEDNANTYASSALFFGVSAGFVIMALGLLSMKPLLRFLGASPNVMPYAESYAFYILTAAPFMCLAFVLNNILRSEGQSFFAMVGMTTGGVMNMILDPILIFRLNMGISGAAIATMMSQLTGALIMAGFFISGRSIVKIKVSFISRHFSDYLLILKTGLPTIFRQGLASFSAALLNIAAAPYGDSAIAAISIANRIYMLVRYIVLGIGQGYQPIAGYCFGAGNYKRVKQVFRLSCIIGTIICTVLGVVIFIFSGSIITWFRDDSEVIAVGSVALKFFCGAMPVMAFSTYVNQTYQALGFSRGATLLASCRQGIFFVPLVMILPRAFGLTGIEMLQATSDIMTFMISIPFIIYFFRKHFSE